MATTKISITLIKTEKNKDAGAIHTDSAINIKEIKLNTII